MTYSTYREYNPETGEWIERPRASLTGRRTAVTGRTVAMVLPDGTNTQRPATGLRRHRADGTGGLYRT